MRNYAKTFHNIFKQQMFWIFARIASERRFLQISKTYVLQGNKNKTKPFLQIIMSVKDALEQQIHYNDSIFWEQMLSL